jgi:drug/metabolite transporter (DMT)-like permease
MSIVVPVSAVSGVALSVLVGVVLVGDRPSVLSWQGIVLAGPALWLVSGGRGRTGVGASPALRDALLASVGIAVQYLALAQTGSEAGAWPILAGRMTATLVVLPLAIASRPVLRAPAVHGRIAAGSAAVGGLAAVALLMYLMATRRELVVVAVVVASLYPVLPVVLGVTVLKERLAKTQAVGLLAAAAAVTFLTLG